MPRKESKTASPASPPPVESTVTTIARDQGEAGNIDKIRDILFGNQVRDFDRRFARLEQTLSKATSDLRTELLKRMDTLESYFRQELDSFKERLKKESELRTDGEKRVSDELKASAAALAKSVQECEDRFEERTRELRQLILEQSKQLTNDVQDKYEQSNKEMALIADRLETAKIDRSTLAEYMVDIAMRLSDHHEIDAAEGATQ